MAARSNKTCLCSKLLHTTYKLCDVSQSYLRYRIFMDAVQLRQYRKKTVVAITEPPKPMMQCAVWLRYYVKRNNQNAPRSQLTGQKRAIISSVMDTSAPCFYLWSPNCKYLQLLSFMAVQDKFGLCFGQTIEA